MIDVTVRFTLLFITAHYRCTVALNHYHIVTPAQKSLGWRFLFPLHPVHNIPYKGSMTVIFFTHTSSDECNRLSMSSLYYIISLLLLPSLSLSWHEVNNKSPLLVFKHQINMITSILSYHNSKRRGVL